jgi:DNA-binding transcriptional MerR regulator
MEKSAEAFRTISEVAEDLDLPQHVLRFWETRFTQIKPLKRGGGRRYYRPEDVELLRVIRQLLYGEGYTIKGVQKILKEQGVRSAISAFRTAAALGGERMNLIFGPGTGISGGSDNSEGLEAPEIGQRPVPESSDTHDFAEHAPGPVYADHYEGDGANAMVTGLDEADLRRLEGLLTELSECERILLLARRS